ncbi:response regulator [Flammeovirga kamogawensis]|uniref:Response regulator transcription factor n=1 Tax=Flammeovirga kamogawensis TaxID=373891 RepID=A0ABX8GS11_9BACT|nr:response regulator transcription factor [Flammeovirga kamogawensis]MBB6461478.1 DNA-binding NarL/FixJ family response regulator [Flammeovirga kamogawensis]QWG06370.1 response regulator transcription factor [Flammeovirga kamogawensis]TRX68199.1 response regulator transcription factor [Flammeovirga kamogawensis]
MEQIKLFLVDDHKMIREGLKNFLLEDDLFKIVGEAANGKECLALLEQNHEIDILLTDMNMPEMDGLELVQIVKEKYPSIKIMALTMLGESQHIKKMLAEGAMGYLLKNCSEAELINGIKMVNAGGTYYSPEVTNAIINNIRKVKPQKSNVALEVALSERETEVLHLILKERTNKEIAEELFISLRTVDAHKRNLLDKTGSKNLAGLILYALDKELFDDI